MGLLGSFFGEVTIDKNFAKNISKFGVTKAGKENLTQLANGQAVTIGTRTVNPEDLLGYAKNGFKDSDAEIAKGLGFIKGNKFDEKAFANFQSSLRGNAAINGGAAEFGKNHQTLGSAINFINEYRKGNTVGQAAKNVFLKDPTGKFDTDNIHYARGIAAIGTGMVAARAGIGAIRGVTTDSAGNADIAGIPFF